MKSKLLKSLKNKAKINNYNNNTINNDVCFYEQTICKGLYVYDINVEQSLSDKVWNMELKIRGQENDFKNNALLYIQKKVPEVLKIRYK